MTAGSGGGASLGWLTRRRGGAERIYNSVISLSERSSANFDLIRLSPHHSSAASASPREIHPILPATCSPQRSGLITRAGLVFPRMPVRGRTRSLPGTTHYRKAELTLIKRQQVLECAYAARPERFVKGPPTVPALPQAVWINRPISLMELAAEHSRAH